LLLLIGAYEDALQTPRLEKFRKNTEGLVIKRQFDEFNKNVGWPPQRPVGSTLATRI
jgi:hypothetical protein